MNQEVPGNHDEPEQKITDYDPDLPDDGHLRRSVTSLSHCCSDPRLLRSSVCVRESERGTEERRGEEKRGEIWECRGVSIKKEGAMRSELIISRITNRTAQKYSVPTPLFISVSFSFSFLLFPSIFWYFVASTLQLNLFFLFAFVFPHQQRWDKLKTVSVTIPVLVWVDVSLQNMMHQPSSIKPTLNTLYSEIPHI